MKSIFIALALFLACGLALAQDAGCMPATAPAVYQPEARELDQILAPVALYPDALLGDVLAASAAPQAQRAFPTPSAAAQALLDAVRANDRAAMAAVLGPGSNELIDSGDATEDAVARLRFIAAAEHSMRVQSRDGRRASLVIGPEEWTIPYGLYWTPTRDAPLSPLGVMFTLAAADETANAEARPYHGYYFRMLPGQGAYANGGAGDYVVKGRMIGGFALIAWPAKYRGSGVRTFIVSHEGIVFSRDFGHRTDHIAKATNRFDPSPLWTEEQIGPGHTAQAARMRHLAGELACTVCHRESSAAEPGLALAPTWAQIAARYKGRLDAEEKLTHAVIEGVDPHDRHWKDRADFTAMGANAPRITPDEARALVRWILSTS